MAIIQISDKIMINSEKIDFIESTKDGMTIVINNKRYKVEHNPAEVLRQIEKEASTNKVLRQSATFPGG